MVNSFSRTTTSQDYDPYATPNSAGDMKPAKEAMAASAYDRDGDGRVRRAGVHGHPRRSPTRPTRTRTRPR